jgi:hypothetical protein
MRFFDSGPPSWASGMDPTNSSVSPRLHVDASKPVTGVCTQPATGSHESRVHVSPSLHAAGFPGSQGGARVVVVVLLEVVVVVDDGPRVVVDVLLVVVTVGCVVLVVVTGTVVVVC